MRLPIAARLPAIFGLIVALALLAGCASETPPPPVPTEPPATATLPAPTAVPATPTLEGPIYDNPVYPRDFPDPHVIVVDGTYYAYGTRVSTSNIPAIKSTDLVSWQPIGDVLPAIPDWASTQSGLTWAPGVIQIGDTFVMYFVARDLASDRQCIGRGVSNSPEGAFIDDSETAFICQVDLGGSIDAYPYRAEDGQLYLYWKNDGNCCGKPVGLWVQALSPDGLSLVGDPVELIRMDQAWERPLIENPAMVEHEDTYYLFYSGNWWESHEYAVGYAVCETLTGPCVKPKDEPIYTFTPDVMGPGGQAFFTDTEGNLWMAYHAWTGPDVGYPGGERSFRIDPVTFVNGEPAITGPTDDPAPLP